MFKCIQVSSSSETSDKQLILPVFTALPIGPEFPITEKTNTEVYNSLNYQVLKTNQIKFLG